MSSIDNERVLKAAEAGAGDSRRESKDAQHDEALKETFPASDPVAPNVFEQEPVRPVHRKPPVIDQSQVDKLAQQVEDEEAR